MLARDADRRAQLAAVAATYAETIVAAVQREYPHHLLHMMHGPDDRPLPHEAHPAFYGCLDWHSAVEMHWALVRLLRLAPEAFDAKPVREVLNRHLTAANLAAEAAYFEHSPGFERPYGWGWLLTLVAELSDWDDADAARWTAAVAIPAEKITELFLAWLPKATYPQRTGLHPNSAFALSRALPWARLAAPELLVAIGAAASRWYDGDRDYPAHYEPSGSDFLSPALTQAELDAELLPTDRFAARLTALLPGIARGEPASLFAPASVSDPADGQITHLNGLNLYRAHAWRRLAGALPGDDERRGPMLAAAEAHAATALPSVVGGHWMAEHWLAAYAVLLLGS